MQISNEDFLIQSKKLKNELKTLHELSNLYYDKISNLYIVFSIVNLLQGFKLILLTNNFIKSIMNLFFTLRDLCIPIKIRKNKILSE